MRSIKTILIAASVAVLAASPAALAQGTQTGTSMANPSLAAEVPPSHAAGPLSTKGRAKTGRSSASETSSSLANRMTGGKGTATGGPAGGDLKGP